MHIRWSIEAADDFESSIRHILQDNPTNAQRVAQM
jgi:plasmid stabilization system protein ParE